MERSDHGWLAWGLSVLQLPDWLPWWVPILVLVTALLWGLAFLVMPFAVFGVKGRLEAIDARLDEIQGEIRSLALRMPEPLRHTQYDEAVYEPFPAAPVPTSRPDVVVGRPPIPPAAPEVTPRRSEGFGSPPLPPHPDPARTSRADRRDPRLDWRG